MALLGNALLRSNVTVPRMTEFVDQILL